MESQTKCCVSSQFKNLLHNTVYYARAIFITRIRATKKNCVYALDLFLMFALHKPNTTNDIDKKKRQTKHTAKKILHLNLCNVLFHFQGVNVK